MLLALCRLSGAATAGSEALRRLQRSGVARPLRCGHPGNFLGEGAERKMRRKFREGWEEVKARGKEGREV